jgi:hypothetical protein
MINPSASGLTKPPPASAYKLTNKTPKPMKLYAFKPQGHGEHSFFTIAKSEEEAIKAVTNHVETVYAKGGIYEYDAAGWGTDYYKMTVVEEGQVVHNNND